MVLNRYQLSELNPFKAIHKQCWLRFVRCANSKSRDLCESSHDFLPSKMLQIFSYNFL